MYNLERRERRDPLRTWLWETSSDGSDDLVSLYWTKRGARDDYQSVTTCVLTPVTDRRLPYVHTRDDFRVSRLWSTGSFESSFTFVYLSTKFDDTKLSQTIRRFRLSMSVLVLRGHKVSKQYTTTAHGPRLNHELVVIGYFLVDDR